MHHHRRKSGHGSGNTSMTDVRKAGTGSEVSSKSRRPAGLTRRSTPGTVHKLGKNPREREREWEEEYRYEEERESFPQYCMTCEKQFIPEGSQTTYCSETCRQYDRNPTYTSSRNHAGYAYSNYPFYASGEPEPRDIIPRASPSRPNSNHFSPPITPTSSQYTSAVSALRSLSIRPPSPPSPTTTNASIWPFTRSAATSPSTSYTRPVSFYSSTYDGGYGMAGYGYGYGSGADGSGMTSERPLPSRKPGAYSRPKSIELVTPMMSR